MSDLAPVVDSIDKVPEPLREYYTESNGKYVLNTNVDEHPGTAGLKSKSATVLSEKKRIEAQLGALTPIIGTRTPEQLAEILAAHESAEDDRAKKAGEFDKLVAQREQRLRAEYEPRVKAGEEAATELADLRFTITIEKAALDGGVDPAKLDDAIAVTKGKRLRPGKKAGEVEVLDAVGELSSRDVKVFFNDDLKKEKPWLYLGSDGRGSGAENAGSRGADRKIPAGVVDMTDSAAILANLDGLASGKVRGR